MKTLKALWDSLCWQVSLLCYDIEQEMKEE
jgi:hypothetical protein